MLDWFFEHFQLKTKCRHSYQNSSKHFTLCLTFLKNIYSGIKKQKLDLELVKMSSVKKMHYSIGYFGPKKLNQT